MTALALGLAILVGLSLGLLGGGGSILTVPIFVYVAGIATKSAVAMSLPVVGFTSLVGAFGHWRAGNVNVRAALTFGAVAMAGAFAGARMSAWLSGPAQLALLAVVMLVAAAAMLRPRPATSVAPESPRSFAIIAAAAAGVGILTGLVGIGGGFLAVPALVVLGRLPMKQAVGTSLLVIAMNSGAGLLGYVGQVEMDWRYIALFAAFATVGIVIGTQLVRFVSQLALRRAFAVFLLCVGALILIKNAGAIA